MSDRHAAVAEAFARFDRERSSCAILVRPLDGDGVELGHRDTEPMPAASVLKVAMAMAVYDAAARGELDLDERVALSVLAPSRHASILTALRDQPTLTLRSLCGLAMTISDNASADYLLRRVGLAAVTRILEDHGCASTDVVIGWRDEELGTRARGNVTTAADALTFVAAAACLPRYAELATFLKGNLRNDRMPLRIPRAVPVAHKTGTLFRVANDVGVIFGPELTLGVAVLTDGEPDVSVTSPAIGDLVGRIWRAHGQSVAW